jgi:hypothetical protein
MSSRRSGTSQLTTRSLEPLPPPKPYPLNHPTKLEDHTSLKRKQLDSLIRETKQNDRMFRQLGAHTRLAQLDKAKRMTETNPLKVDQLALYSRNLANLRRKYAKEMQWGVLK